MAYLGVNIDHVATLRQARQTNEPDPVWAAAMAELGGADCITLHLREDRRHIQDRDLELLKQTTKVRLNLELACDPAVIAIACRVLPDQVTLVPEKRQEVTTEGGLDIVTQRPTVERAIADLRGAGIDVSLFLDPDLRQVEQARSLGAQAVEIHTGQYAECHKSLQDNELHRIQVAAKLVMDQGLVLHAGHGLDYQNVVPIARISGMQELNIGHSIVCRALFVGMAEATRQMKALIS